MNRGARRSVTSKPRNRAAIATWPGCSVGLQAAGGGVQRHGRASATGGRRCAVASGRRAQRPGSHFGRVRGDGDCRVLFEWLRQAVVLVARPRARRERQGDSLWRLSVWRAGSRARLL